MPGRNPPKPVRGKITQEPLPPPSNHENGTEGPKLQTPPPDANQTAQEASQPATAQPITAAPQTSPQNATEQRPPQPTSATPEISQTEPETNLSRMDPNELRLLTVLGTPGALKDTIDLDLVRSTPHTREKVVDFLQRTAMGDRFLEAAQIADITWNQFRMLAYTHPMTLELYDFCKSLGRPVRQCRREIELDHRGTVGVRSPVYYKGAVVGHVLKPSDKCLELALKGGDTEGKYADRQKVETSGQAVIYHIHGVERTPVEKLVRPDILDR